MVFLLATAVGARVQAGEIKLEAQLIWGTNEEKNPEPLPSVNVRIPNPGIVTVGVTLGVGVMVRVFEGVRVSVIIGVLVIVRVLVGV